MADFLASEPLYAVLSEDKYRQVRLTAETEEEFFRTGDEYVGRVVDLGSRLIPGARQKALEFGCGPGRVAIGLARRYRNVVAVDASEPVLAIARRYALQYGALNISFQSADEFRHGIDSFDFVNCSLVLQRLDHREGLALLGELLNRVTSGGVIAVQFPYLSRATILKRATRWLRGTCAWANSAANLLLGKKASEPFVATSIYSIPSILRLLEARGFQEIIVSLAAEQELDTATVMARSAPLDAVATSDATGGKTAEELTPEIDVRELLAGKKIADLNATAETYFASLQDWTFQLAKPFASVGDAPAILMNLAVLLQGLNLRPGDRVLDFGGGSGWLSRILTQMGGRVVVCDVSPTALRMAETLYRQWPPMGRVFDPEFLLFNGTQLELPDQSVERVVCFDAFHHVPNPHGIIKELARVLTPGGVAAFAEPGPEHSRSPQSQFEMRTYGVVENDIDVDRLWTVARAEGFCDLRLAVFNIPPFHLSLDAFKDMLAGGGTADRWSDATRASLRNVRDFFLIKSGSEPLDSRDNNVLQCTMRIDAVSVATEVGPSITVTATNTGPGKWLPASAGVGGVWIGCHLFDVSERLIQFDFARVPLTMKCPPGGSVTLALQLPALGPERRILEVDCVAEGVSWFGPQGNRTLRISIPP